MLRLWLSPIMSALEANVILDAFSPKFRYSMVYRNGNGLYAVSASLLSFGVKSFLASSTIGTMPMNTAATVASIPILGLVKTAPHTEALSAEQLLVLTTLVSLSLAVSVICKRAALLTWVGSAMWSFKFSSGPFPVVAAWLQKPATGPCCHWHAFQLEACTRTAPSMILVCWTAEGAAHRGWRAWQAARS